MDIMTKILITTAVLIPLFFVVGLFEAVVIGPFRGPEQTYGGIAIVVCLAAMAAIGVLKCLALVWFS
jgi:hypothetical protein